ncbi:Protein of uncharacterised function (DUF3036) [Slackia heliotrinireducens]|uniref:DUF2975 domain-containing protein n=1 Tax=Slackia heliotrinireducens (strain ATCC 29202 / DSM 20476 / NCTC 11029 / RHS 1) TaxID=471855 RepID=C7N5K4_SLAHD|nr:DUF2975 domain-containing protein [Slackia heliotrinireducens]ACV22189.1 hypothetical protein Shel_11550 [Slackia heliotrinireducens DSM 20476]VEH00282.1 Protein of uncharacterised function (DUF3036) [Slackia heliotrinireducens]
MNHIELGTQLKALDIILGICCVVMAFVVMPVKGQQLAALHPDLAYLFVPCLIGGWIGLAAPLAMTVIAFPMFRNIANGDSFTDENARILKKISYLAGFDVLLLLVAIVVFVFVGALYLGAFMALVTGIVVMGSVAIVAAALSHLTLKAAQLQAENDLTV